MSTTDDSYLVAKDKTADIPLREKWWRILDNYKVGIIPLPFFILAGVLILLDCTEGKLPSDIVVMVATTAFFGFACGEFGKRLPLIGKMGAAAICATFIPSALVHYGLLPDVVVESTTKFYKSTNILYLYICCIIVGSIMSMNRRVLIQVSCASSFRCCAARSSACWWGWASAWRWAQAVPDLLLPDLADHGRRRG